MTADTTAPVEVVATPIKLETLLVLLAGSTVDEPAVERLSSSPG